MADNSLFVSPFFQLPIIRIKGKKSRKIIGRRQFLQIFLKNRPKMLQNLFFGPKVGFRTLIGCKVSGVISGKIIAAII